MADSTSRTASKTKKSETSADSISNPSSQKKVGMRDIAKETGFHVSSVSLALRRDPSISPETMEKIIQCANRLGYQKDQSLNIFMTKVRSNEAKNFKIRMAYLIESKKKFESDPNYQRHYHGAKEEAKRIGYDLVFYPLKESGMTLSQSLHSLKFQGVKILIVSGLDIKILNGINPQNFTTILVGYAYRDFNYVSCDYFDAMNQVMERVQGARYKKIGLIFWHDPNWSRTNSHFLASALLSETKSKSIKFVPWMLTETFEKQKVLDWYKQHQPDLIIGDYDQVYHWIRELNPRIGFVHLFQNNAYPEIAGIDQQLELVGEKAIDLAANLVLQNQSGLKNFTQHVSILGKWNPGKSFNPK